MSAKARSESQEHVCLKRGASAAEQRAQLAEEKHKIAPFALETSTKPLMRGLSLVPNGSFAEVNRDLKTIAPFHASELKTIAPFHAS
jgi:hypothetical protein